MSQVDPEGLGVAGLAQEVRPDLFGELGPGRGGLDDLPAPLAGEGEEAVVQTQTLVAGVAWQPGGQQVGTGHQAEFAAFPLYGEDGAAVEVPQVAGGEGQAKTGGKGGGENNCR